MLAVIRETDAQRKGFAKATLDTCIVEAVLIVLGVQMRVRNIAKMVSAVSPP